MALTGRVPLLLLLGLVPVAIAPGLLTVRLWWLATVALVGVDLLLALSPRRLVVTREPVAPVRLGAEGASALLLANPGTRRRPAAGPRRVAAVRRGAR